MNQKNTTAKAKCRGILIIMCLVWMSMSCMTAAASKPARVKKVTVTAYGTTGHRVKWTRVKGATGYQVYCRDYSSSVKKYKKIKTVKASYNGTIIRNRKQGKAYGYVVRAYKKTSKKITYGKLSPAAYGFIKKPSSSSGGTSGNTSNSDTNNTNSGSSDSGSTVSSGILVNPSATQKSQKVFGKSSLNMRYPGGYYSSASKAAANMKSITVKTWDFKKGKSGTKITRTWTIKVHKNLASTVEQIFKEIYEGEEKFPIHELGGYAWRGGHSEHNTGTAIDINWTENYMVNIATGAITAGKYWRPGSDPYSIPKNGEVAKIFKKYGFSQGDWGNSKDYMHFSYFGT